jgi:hypothetical protein
VPSTRSSDSIEKTASASPWRRSGEQLVDRGVRAVAADAFGVEDADADDEVVHRQRRAQPDAHLDRIAGLKDMTGLAVGAEQRDVRDLDLARAPASFRGAEHVGRAGRGLDGIVRQDGRRRLVGRHDRRDADSRAFASPAASSCSSRFSTSVM